MALEGEVVAKYRQGDRDYDIRLQLAPDDRTSVSSVLDLTLPQTGRRMGAAAGAPRLVRVSDVADPAPGTGPATIERMNRQRQIVVSANLDGRTLGEVVKDIQAGLDKIQRPAGMTFVFGGETERMQETFSNMGLALLVAIIFIYFVLASQFESFVHPFTIMAALPLAIVGAFVLLFLTGNPIGMPRHDRAHPPHGARHQERHPLGRPHQRAARPRQGEWWRRSSRQGPTRLRPILMTSAAMVLGMLPAALARAEGSEFRAPMAIAVIGGVITSTFLTLVVVPIVYTWMDRLTLKQRSSATRDPYHDLAHAEEKGLAPLAEETNRREVG